MIIKRFFAAAALAVIVGTTASAAPEASLSGVANGSMFDWTLSFTPDTSMFTNTDEGLGGSLGIAFQIETEVGGLVLDSWDTVDGFEDPTAVLNPGTNPYENNDPTDGVRDYTNVASDLGTGNVDAIFVPLGSTFFTSGGEKAALTFTTNVDTVSFGGLISQAGVTDLPIAAMTVVADGGLLFGDATNDGAVTGADLTAVTTEFGKTGAADGLLLGDATDDGAVTGADLTAVTTEFGNTLPLSAVSSTTVPEPSAVVLLLGAAGLLAGFKVRQR